MKASVVLRLVGSLTSYAVRVLLINGLSALCGLGAVLLTATRTANPGWLFGVGLSATTGALALGLYVGLRVGRARRDSRRARRTMTAAVLAVAMTTVLATVLPACVEPQPELDGSGYWELPTGSRLQYLHASAGRSATSARPPVIFLHGGPGVADLKSDLQSFSPLTALGYEVYAYAQLGAGGSTRLADPGGYGRSRDVEDLEAIRSQLGATRLILIGHSYGGGLAAAYAARHPDRVARMVLISPAPLNPDDTSPLDAKARLTTRQALSVYRQILPPRPLLTYLLLQINPRAAHAFMGDREADHRNDKVLVRSEGVLHCAGSTPHLTTSRSGFYAFQFPQSAGAPRPPDLRSALRRVAVPALIVKGSCDYLSWSSALDYREALPDSTLLYFSSTGHNAHQDRPAEVLGAVTEFLEGRPLAHPYEESGPPVDFEGPLGR